MNRLRVVLPVVLATVVPLLSPAGIAEAAEPALIGGTVLGATVSSPATVTVLAWPAQKTLDILAVHGTYPIARLATTTTGAGGKFAVPASVTDRLAETYRGPAGQLNLEIWASAPAGSTAWTTSVVPTPAGWTSTDASVADSVQASTTLSLARTAAERASQGAVGAFLGTGKAPEPNAAYPCVLEDLGRAGPTQAVIANVWGNPLHAYGRVHYTAASSHTLGVAVSWTGAVGDYRAEGSQTATAGVGFDTNFTVINHQLSAAWWYQKYRHTCVGVAQYILRPREFYTGPRSVGIGTRAFTHACVTYQRGWDFYRESGANHSFSTGVNVGGVGVVSQVGWSNATTVYYRFGRTGRMCASQPSGLYLADFVGSM